MRQSTANTPVYILSVKQAHLTDKSNNRADQEARIYFKAHGISYKVVNGCYKGVTELSYVVNAAHAVQVRELAARYNQDSVLFLDSDRSAFLRYLDSFDHEVYIGQFKSTSAQIALGRDAYTHDETADLYYVVDK